MNANKKFGRKFCPAILSICLIRVHLRSFAAISSLRLSDSAVKKIDHQRKSRRGLVGFVSSSLWMASIVGSSIVGGSMICTSANKSPGVPDFGFTPWPRIRSLAPLLVRGGIRRLMVPPGVGTSTFAPLTASASEIGKRTIKIVAAALKPRMRRDVNGQQQIAGRTAACTGCAWPRNRIFAPPLMPAGILTSICSTLPSGRCSADFYFAADNRGLKRHFDFAVNIGTGFGCSGASFAILFAAGSSGAAKEIGKRTAAPLAPFAESFAKELAQIDLFEPAARRTLRVPCSTARAGPSSAPRPPPIRTRCRNGRRVPACWYRSARRRPTEPFGIFPWPSCRRDSGRGDIYEPDCGTPSGYPPAKRSFPPPEFDNNRQPLVPSKASIIS